MITIRSIAVLLCTIAGPVAAQVVVTVDEERKASRLLFVSGFEKPAEVSVHYGATMWREEYLAAVTGKMASNYRLGTGYWTSLHSNVELKFGKKTAPASVWYLGLLRDEENQWHLSLMDSAKVHRTKLTSGATRDVRPDLLVPLRLTKEKESAERLSIRVVAVADQGAAATEHSGKGQLVLRWGPHRAVADFAASVVVGKPAGEPAFAPFDPARVVTTKSGLRYQELRPGVGKQPEADSKVTVHYVGWTSDGAKFDSSFARQAATFPLSRVIKGWQEGIPKMKPGAIYRFEIPPDLAYGNRGGGPIKPNATLVFWVELLSF